MSAKEPSHNQVLNRLYEFIESDNVAELLTEEQLAKVARDVVEGFNIDNRSRDEWEKTAKASMDIALQVKQQKNYPFPGASNVKWPLITVAALQFNARAYPAIVEGDEIVKAKVVGNDDGVPEIDPATGQQAAQPPTQEGEEPQPIWKEQPGAKAEKAQRISEHMSYQLMEEMTEWEEDTDTLLIQLPIVGTAFKKVYFDQALERNVSELIPGIDLIVNQATRSLNDAPRVTHRFQRDPNQVEERMRAGIWSEIDLGSPSSADGDDMAPHDFIEQHCWLDLDEDGYREPYIVTVHVETDKVVRIAANYGQEDVKQNAKGDRVIRIEKRDYFVKYGFIPDPKGGFYDIGFGTLLESLGAAIDTTMNQMLDAGHLQNAGGGFIGSGIRLKKSMLRMEPGLYRTIDATGQNIRDAIYNMEHPGPSAVLFSLLGMLIEAGKDITATKDILTGQTSENQTATTTLALIEQGTKVFTAIFKRVYRSLKQEFKLLYKLNADFLPDEAYFNVLDTPKAIAKTDYVEGTYDVCPQADPKNVTDMQRMARAEALIQVLANDVKGELDSKEILTRYFVATGQQDVDKLFAPQQGPDPIAMADAETKIAKTQSETELNQAKKVQIIGQVEQQGIENQVAAVDAMEAPHKDKMDRDERAEERALKAQPKAAA
jgi:chaperonin GroES